MRLRILKDTPTVGLMLKKGEVHEVQETLAAVLVEGGKAEDACKPKKKEKEKEPKLAPARPRIVEEPAPEPVKKPKAPAKKKAAKKPAKKKAAAKKKVSKR